MRTQWFCFTVKGHKLESAHKQESKESRPLLFPHIALGWPVAATVSSEKDWTRSIPYLVVQSLDPDSPVSRLL